MLTKILDWLVAQLINAGGRIYTVCSFNDQAAAARLLKADNELRRNESEFQ